MPEENVQAAAVARNIAALATPANAANLSALSSQLISDSTVREQFLANPNAVLSKLGVAGSNVVLSARDKEVVQLIGDTTVTTLYQEGNVAQLQGYLKATYPSLVLSVLPGQVLDAAADFDVLIEAEVIAVAVVAVAAAAIGSIELPQEIQARPETAVLQARVAGLEARMANIEAAMPQAGQWAP